MKIISVRYMKLMCITC